MTYEYRNYIIRTTFCPFRTVTKSCPVETVPACPVQIRAHRYIAVYIDSNNAMRNGNINKHMLKWHDVKIETRHDVMSDEYAGDYIDNMDV